ncbi:unnamed protein product [Rhizophagus irregularis]|nr:unnamed protein product [Rhizophagus irregularis]
MNTGISEKTLKKWEAESKKKKDINYKLSLAAKDLYLKAESLGSFEAKLCLGAIYSIGLTKPKDYKPAKAKKYFKKIAKKNER